MYISLPLKGFHQYMPLATLLHPITLPNIFTILIIPTILTIPAIHTPSLHPATILQTNYNSYHFWNISRERLKMQKYNNNNKQQWWYLDVWSPFDLLLSTLPVFPLTPSIGCFQSSSSIALLRVLAICIFVILYVCIFLHILDLRRRRRALCVVACSGRSSVLLPQAP